MKLPTMNQDEATRVRRFLAALERGMGKDVSKALARLDMLHPGAAEQIGGALAAFIRRDWLAGLQAAASSEAAVLRLAAELGEVDA